jgi:hypothetical protein
LEIAEKTAISERGLSETAGELAIPAAIIGNGGKIGYSGEADCRK